MFWQSRTWTVFIAALILGLSVLSAFFVFKKEAELEHSMDHFMSLSTDNYVWGTEQLRVDISRVREALSTYGDAHIPFDQPKAQVAADILASRFETIGFATKRLDRHLQTIIIGNQSFDELWKQHLILDRDLAAFFRAPSPEQYLLTVRRLDTIEQIAAVFATETLHASQYHSHQIREDILARAADYEISLFVILFGSFAFVVLAWFFYWKVTVANRDLSQAVQRAEEAAQAKNQFLSSMSHEFRTPLNAISGYVQLILMKMAPEEREQNAMYESAIEQSVDNLVELIDQVLELDTLMHRQENLILDTLDVRMMVSNAIKLSARPALTKHIKIHQNLADDECLIETDSGMFTQAVSCLLSNAIKFNHDDGEVWITCARDRNEGSVTIEIEDNGIGIPRGKEMFLFAPFDRLGRESGVINGAGTGLTICKEICARLGVELGYKRGLSGGSIFWLSAPRIFDVSDQSEKIVRKRSAEGSEKVPASRQPRNNTIPLNPHHAA